MYYIWITGYEQDGWYVGVVDDRVEVCESIWGAMQFPTRSAAASRANMLYDNFDAVRNYEIVER